MNSGTTGSLGVCLSGKICSITRVLVVFVNCIALSSNFVLFFSVSSAYLVQPPLMTGPVHLDEYNLCVAVTRRDKDDQIHITETPCRWHCSVPLCVSMTSNHPANGADARTMRLWGGLKLSFMASFHSCLMVTACTCTT